MGLLKSKVLQYLKLSLRCVMQNIFREYDIRGIFPSELNKETVQTIGFLLGEHVGLGKNRHVAIGYDARTHSHQLFTWLASGFAKAGFSVLDLGLIPTPVAYFVMFEEHAKAALCVMITGSHNPKEYNGFKITIGQKPFFGQDIMELGKAVEASVNARIATHSTPTIISDNALERYIDYLSHHFAHIRGFKIPLAIDCGNGVVGVGITALLKRLEIPYTGLYMEPDGNFPHHHPDPTEEKNLRDIKAVVQQQGGIGFAFDGDGDRLVALTPRRVLKGDDLAIIFAQTMTNPIVVGEVKCSMNMYNSINTIGKAIMYKTGHSNIKTKIKEINASLGAEVSGHLFFNDRYFGYDDATYAALRLLELIQQGMDIDAMLDSLPLLYSTDELKIHTTESAKFAIIEQFCNKLQNPPSDFPAIKDIISVDGVRIVFEEGWALLRASNTTPMLVTRFESSRKENVERYKNCLYALLESVMKDICE